MSEWYRSPFQPPTQVSFYQPPAPPEPPRTSEGEEIFFGPYNSEQAPFLECGSCGTPITVGQRVLALQECVVGVTATGKLVFWPVADTFEPTSVHSDCSAEFSHDHITKEPCGEEGDVERFCAACGTRLDGELAEDGE